MSFIPAGPAALVPYLLAMDPTGDGQFKLRSALQYPPEKVAEGDLPLAFCEVALDRPYRLLRYSPARVGFEYSIYVYILTDPIGAGPGNSQQYASLLPWPALVGVTIGQAQTLGGAVIRCGFADGSGDLVRGEGGIRKIGGKPYAGHRLELKILETFQAPYAP